MLLIEVKTTACDPREIVIIQLFKMAESSGLNKTSSYCTTCQVLLSASLPFFNIQPQGPPFLLQLAILESKILDRMGDMTLRLLKIGSEAVVAPLACT